MAVTNQPRPPWSRPCSVRTASHERQPSPCCLCLSEFCPILITCCINRRPPLDESRPAVVEGHRRVDFCHNPKQKGMYPVTVGKIRASSWHHNGQRFYRTSVQVTRITLVQKDLERTLLTSPYVYVAAACCRRMQLTRHVSVGRREWVDCQREFRV
ncbi:uncharacterized protein K452DRAFT_88678 [Aplosporella prunicola CBS 121167]|uniref:Uncharacterized protein n=1 Tax=Aplosporella prunicola CBS 121167 TaxID=1176127 RepID=A0A6A6B702_9PEZI|nr:uncharacterized protein K452DRAFT_88678 [Aplosporella prunicola CBS 121167]KAF2138581.1 hypothetical protein K452DRAFT_88678 [Aplosporella prunicola CBS 121167]